MDIHTIYKNAFRISFVNHKDITYVFRFISIIAFGEKLERISWLNMLKPQITFVKLLRSQGKVTSNTTSCWGRIANWLIIIPVGNKFNREHIAWPHKNKNKNINLILEEGLLSLIWTYNLNSPGVKEHKNICFQSPQDHFFVPIFENPISELKPGALW